MESGEYVFPTSVEPDKVGVPAPKFICEFASAWKPNAMPCPICVAISRLSWSEEGGPVKGGCVTPKGCTSDGGRALLLCVGVASPTSGTLFPIVMSNRDVVYSQRSGST